MQNATKDTRTCTLDFERFERSRVCPFFLFFSRYADVTANEADKTVNSRS